MYSYIWPSNQWPSAIHRHACMPWASKLSLLLSSLLLLLTQKHWSRRDIAITKVDQHVNQRHCITIIDRFIDCCLFLGSQPPPPTHLPKAWTSLVFLLFDSLNGFTAIWETCDVSLIWETLAWNTCSGTYLVIHPFEWFRWCRDTRNFSKC